MLKAIRKKLAHEDIVKQIRSLIKKGKVKRGDRLPTERELSETFKVSRATVREAIFSLANMHLLERRQGDGTYVTASSEEALVQPLATYFFQEKDDMIDIFFLRKIIEPEIAKLAAENATPEEFIELEEILEEQKRRVISRTDPIPLHFGFHHSLARIAKNRVLEHLMLALFPLMRITREKYIQTKKRQQESLNGHLSIYTAIKKGNGTAARKAMRRHLEDLEKIMFEKERKTG